MVCFITERMEIVELCYINNQCGRVGTNLFADKHASRHVHDESCLLPRKSSKISANCFVVK